MFIDVLIHIADLTIRLSNMFGCLDNWVNLGIIE